MSERTCRCSTPTPTRVSLSSWAKGATAYAIQAGIFMPAGNQILPKQMVTNAEALAWVREARYPLFTFLSTNDFHGQLETGKVGQQQTGGRRGLQHDLHQQLQGPQPARHLAVGRAAISCRARPSRTCCGASPSSMSTTTWATRQPSWATTSSIGARPALQERMAQADFPILLANVFIRRHRYPSRLAGPNRHVHGQGPAGRRDRRDQQGHADPSSWLATQPGWSSASLGRS